jgi:hypothetical protein
LFFLQTCKFITFTIKKKDLPLPDWWKIRTWGLIEWAGLRD